MKNLPAEFADLLTPKGRRILDGRDRKHCGALADPATRFVQLQGVIDTAKARALRDLLDRALLGSLQPMEQIIHPDTIWEMTENYSEQLPKVTRVKTALLESRREKSYRIAEELGLVALLKSESFAQFAASVAGRPLRRKWGIQTLCYGPGDYVGPHNDHHPEDPEARHGYVDMHVSLATEAVAHQWLVYAKSGHFTEITGVHTLGGVTVYRLPFWHYTTPLVAKSRREADARRWVLLGTFLHASEKARTNARIDPPRAA